MISIRNLSIQYGQIEALKSVSLNIQLGEWVLITGPSGCGKSTLAKAIAGIIPHSIPAKISAPVFVDGIDSQKLTLAEIAQKVGMVFQNPGSQLFHLLVEDEIAFGPRNLGLPECEVQERVTWALNASGIGHLRDFNPMHLSGGQKQIVAITSLLAMRPKVLVLDEPSASLDIPSTFQVMETLSQLRKRHNIAIVMVEHRLDQTLKRIDRVVLMEEGEIVEDGSPEIVLANQIRRDQLGLRRPIEKALSPWEQLIQVNGKSESTENPLLVLEEVAAGYDGKNVIHGIDLTVYPGDFLAVVGPNGVGKSTLALVMSGLIKPSTGQINFQGSRKSPKPGKDVALLFQDAADQLFTDCVNDEVAFGPKNFDCFTKESHHKILSQADLLSLAKRPPIGLSVGQQQRTALAACLALCPKLVILDEPTLGQDWGHLQQIMNFVQQLNQLGTAVVVISHDYKLIHHYTEKIYLMEDGRIKMSGKTRRETLETQGESYEIQYA